MSESLERTIPMRPHRIEASFIICQNKGVKLSENVLRKLRRAGLRLIPQMSR